MSDASWIEVSLTVNGEMAEAVAEVLARFAPSGVVIESTEIAPDPEGEGTPTGPLRVCAYLPGGGELEETRRQIETALWYLGRAWPENPLPEPVFAPLQEVNWVDTWKQHYNPIPVGERLMIVPAWIEMDVGGRIPIRMEPGMAFGTGTHPTTQLCLEAIEEIFTRKDYQDRIGPTPSVIDVGCGSGILSIAALKLGAAAALGVDVDPQALPVAQENAVLNEIGPRLVLGSGSVAEILAGQFSLKEASVVLANILAPIIIKLLGQGLGELLKPGGVMVLSGILEEQWQASSGMSPLQEALNAAGLSVEGIRKQGDWVAVTASRRTVTSSTF